MADDNFRSRKIVERIVVEGTLVLETPTHLGNGDAEGLTDMPLLRDETDQHALLPGTSIAGALRNYLRERLLGYQLGEADSLSASMAEMVRQLREARPPALGEEAREREQDIAWLFGGVKGDDEGGQSALIIEDARGTRPCVELRDGVRIDPETRTALYEQDDAGRQGRGYKFDLELLEAGTEFDLRFELLVTQDKGHRLKQLLATALGGLAAGEIGLGLRKQRGFGRCRVPIWTITRYDLTRPVGLLTWLAEDHLDWGLTAEKTSGTDIGTCLDVMPLDDDRRSTFTLDAEFALTGSLLIRAGFGRQDTGPDVAHLTSTRVKSGESRPVPVVSGTSLAGVLRGRALRILRTLRGETEERQISQTTRDFIDVLFGPGEITSNSSGAFASRLFVKETEIVVSADAEPALVQNRIRLDRFTGGAYETALFNEQPLFATPETRVQVSLALRAPRPSEVGLVALLLKDLWLGDLVVGGESSIGRGRMSGLTAQLQWGDDAWTIEQVASGAPLSLTGNWRRLEACVQALQEELAA